MALKVDPVRLIVEVFMTLRCRRVGLVFAWMMTEVVFMDIVSCFGLF
jgi:cytochrome c oxidase subunit IV